MCNMASSTWCPQEVEFTPAERLLLPAIKEGAEGFISRNLDLLQSAKPGAGSSRVSRACTSATTTVCLELAVGCVKAGAASMDPV
jgi:hypothetical protein